VSGAIGNRAAVFTNQPQDVEVYQAGAWWPGSLLGWRHDAHGGCQVWVRVVLDGVEETAWTDLATLRLPERRPERHLSVAPAPAHTQEMAAQSPSGARNHPLVRNLTAPDFSSTQSLGGLRDRSAPAPAPAARPAGGRRRAPDTGELPAVGSIPASAVAPRAPGGRRRAPDTGELPAVPGAPSGPAAVPAGRHRIAAAAGRHRAADTGLFPVVGGQPEVERRQPEPEADLFTRPMRLNDLVPSRKPRLDGSFSRA
jgi:hypothetical protein